MSLFGGILDGLIGAPSTSEAMSKEDIDWLMQKSMEANRTDKQGLFGGWDWTQGQDGRWTQTENVNEALLPGIENMMGQISGNQESYQAPEQFGKLLDAMMGNKMEQYGMDASGYQPSGQAPQQPQGAAYAPPEKPQQMFNNGVGGTGQFDPRQRIPRDYA